MAVEVDMRTLCYRLNMAEPIYGLPGLHHVPAVRFQH